MTAVEEPTPSHLDNAEVHVNKISSSLSPHHRVEHAMREIIAHLREQEENHAEADIAPEV